MANLPKEVYLTVCVEPKEEEEEEEEEGEREEDEDEEEEEGMARRETLAAFWRRTTPHEAPYHTPGCGSG